MAGRNRAYLRCLKRSCFLAAFVVLSLHAPATAATQPQTLRVATRIIPPFVFEEDGRLTGFSVDLWRSIEEALQVKSEFVMTSTVTDLLTAVKSGKADLGIAAISITAERSQDFDFSQPMFDSGLQIMVPATSRGNGFLPAMLGFVLSYAVLPLVGLILLSILIPAHLVWWSERRHPAGMLQHRSYFPGIFEACWWALATLATQADQMPRSAVGRIIASIWMFTAVVFVAYFTANITASLTVRQLHGDISGPDDLPGRSVATVAGSTSAEYLRRRNIQTIDFPRIEEAFEALLEKQAEAVVFDAPVLLYYAARQGSGRTSIVGPVFRKENYGIVFPQNSPHRKPVNNALLTLKETGVYQRLYDKWFTNR